LFCALKGSEMETISDGRAKHEFNADFNSIHKEAGIETTGQLHEKDGQCSDLADVEATHWQSFSYERKTVFSITQQFRSALRNCCR